MQRKRRTLQDGLRVIYGLNEKDQVTEIRGHLLGLAEIGLKSTRHIRLARIMDITSDVLKVVWHSTKDLERDVDRDGPVVELDLMDVTSIFKA
jgi:hypothetical protein